MATIAELRREIAKEKNYAESEKEINEFSIERRQLEKKLKDLKFKRKYGKATSAVKPIVEGTKSTIKKIGEKVRKMQEEQTRRDKLNFKPQKRVGLFG